MFINDESIHNVRPCPITGEEGVYYTQSKDGKSVYALFTGFSGENRWNYGERKEILLKDLKSGKNTSISVLGHNGKVLEYNPDVDPKPTFQQTDDGLLISVMRAQRIYNNKRWPNTVVVKLDNVDFVKN